MKLILSGNKFYIDGNCYTHHFLSLPPLTTCHQNHWLSAEVHFESEPRISPMGEVTFKKEKLTEHTPSFRVTLTANEHTDAYNRIYIALEAEGYPEPLVIPVTVLG